MNLFWVLQFNRIVQRDYCYIFHKNLILKRFLNDLTWASVAKCEYLRAYPLTPEKKQKMTRIPFASTNDSLMYAIIRTRPYIAYDMGLVSKSDPNPIYWQAMKRIFTYLKGTAHYSLSYKGVDLELISYIDVDWAGDLEHHKSIFAYVFLLNGGAITWASMKQTCIVLSTMEVEFVVATTTVQECVWLRYFLHCLGVTSSLHLVVIFYDNQVIITYTKDPKYHNQTKHINIEFNFIRDLVQ